MNRGDRGEAIFVNDIDRHDFRCGPVRNAIRGKGPWPPYSVPRSFQGQPPIASLDITPIDDHLRIFD
jgi:hypothetical protein